jgi:hypothetical protein
MNENRRVVCINKKGVTPTLFTPVSPIRYYSSLAHGFTLFHLLCNPPACLSECGLSHPVPANFVR